MTARNNLSELIYSSSAKQGCNFINNIRNTTMIDQDLRQEVIELNNGLFDWKITDDEVDVPTAVMAGITGLYADGEGSPFYTARIAENCVNNIQDENMKLEICKHLLLGEKVRIPGMDEDFCVWEVFYDLYTGEKINREDQQDY